MALTNIQVKQAKPEGKPYKLADGKGMYLYVTVKGHRYWRFDYRYGGKRKTLAMGVYPDVSLAVARTKREKARQQIDNDLDPSDVQRAKKVTKTESQENSFKAVGLEWFAKEKPHWSDSHIKRVNGMLNKELFPFIGDRPLLDITPPDLLACLRRVESRGAIETAHRVKQVAGQVFRYGVATGRADRDISTDLKDALPAPIKSHLAAIIDSKEVGILLITLDDHQGKPEVATAFIFSTKRVKAHGVVRD